MGEFADRLNVMFGVSREDQDRFGLRSHIMADQAAKAGNLSDIVPVQVPGLENPIIADNGIRPATLEKLAKLRLKPFGFLSTFRHNVVTRNFCPSTNSVNI